MELAEAKELALDIMRNNGERDLIAEGWRFKFNDAQRQFGICKFGAVNRQARTAMPGWVELSRPITLLNDRTEVEDTIRHEVAHALTPFAREAHDYEWKAMARRVGARPERCYSSAEEGGTVKVPPAPLVALCPGCKREVGRFSMPERGRSTSCHKCSGGRYNERFKLEFVRRGSYEEKQQRARLGVGQPATPPAPVFTPPPPAQPVQTAAREQQKPAEGGLKYADIVLALSSLTPEQLRSLNTEVVEELRRQRAEVAAVMRHTLQPGDVRVLSGLRSPELNGVRVKVVRPKETKALVEMLESAGRFRQGEQVNVPMSCLKEEGR